MAAVAGWHQIGATWWHRPAVAARSACVVLIAAVAATAPVNPNPLMTRGMWVAAPIIAVYWPRITTLDVAALLVPAWVTLAAYEWIWLPAVRHTVWAYWSVVGLFVAARSVLRGRREIRVLCCAYLVGSLYAALKVIDAGRHFTVDPNPAMTRAAIEGINPNYTAYALATAVAVVAVALRTCELSTVAKAAFLLTLPVIGYAILLTDTRGAMVGAVGVVAYWFASAWSPQAVWSVVASAASVAMIVVPLGWLGDERMLWVQRFFARKDDSLSGRLPVWEYARDLWGQHPWTGIGAGMFPVSNPYGIGAHNIVLTLLIETGVVGLGLYAAVMVGSLVGRSGGAERHRVGGIALAAWLPMWLTGHWELSPAAWLVAAVFSVLVGARAHRGGAHRHADRRLCLRMPERVADGRAE